MSCSTCRTIPCRCTIPCTSYPGTTLVPQPFYAAGVACKEDHTNNVYVQQFAYGILIQSSWNIPLCGGAAILSVPGTYAVSVGSYIWNSNFGYFQIVSFDAVAQTISIQNPCFTDNAAPGVEVPACTTFAVGPEPCCEDVGQTGIFVKYDFTAPADGDCIDITLTFIDGLITGNNLQIGSGIYKLNEVKANDVVTICNQGEGITPGTPVIAQNINGQYQYPVIQLSINPCEQPVIGTGAIIACDTNGMSPITGSNGYVFTIDDAVTGSGTFKTFNAALEASCTPEISVGDITLTTALTSGAIVLDANGFAAITISTNLKEITLAGTCNYFVKAHVSVAMQPDILFIDVSHTGAVYHEMEFVWDTNAFPATNTCGKIVTMQYSSDAKDISGFPVGGFPATFTQLLPPVDFDMTYYQYDVEALALSTGGTTLQLEMYYRILVGDNYAVTIAGPTRFMVSGWLEIFRR